MEKEIIRIIEKDEELYTVVDGDVTIKDVLGALVFAVIEASDMILCDMADEEAQDTVEIIKGMFNRAVDESYSYFKEVRGE